jgi:hypothetical protein
MQTSRFIDFSTFLFNCEIFADSCQELFRSQAIQVFNNTIIVDNR